MKVIVLNLLEKLLYGTLTALPPFDRPHNVYIVHINHIPLVLFERDLLCELSTIGTKKQRNNSIQPIQIGVSEKALNIIDIIHLVDDRLD